jgi:hypothetical protein
MNEKKPRNELKPRIVAVKTTPAPQRPTTNLTMPKTAENFTTNQTIFQERSSLRRSKNPRLVRPYSQD